MKKVIEVELRGGLSDSGYADLRAFLDEKGTHEQTKDRVILDYTTFLGGEGVRERQKDIRLRVTNSQPEIVTKIGGWGGDEHRQEISILCEKGSFDRLVETYAALGYTKAILAVRKSEVYMYKEFEFALVGVPNHSFYFEIESITDDEGQVEAKKEAMRELCSELNLELFDDSAFYEYIEELNREANEVFEYSNYTRGYFAERFNLDT